MENREYLSAILARLLDDINAYLKNKYVAFSKEDKESLGAWKCLNAYAAKHNGVIFNESLDLYICIPYSDFRNLELMAHRVSNLLQLRGFLKSTMNNLSNARNGITNDQFRFSVRNIKTELQTAIERNDFLNAEYNKHHITYMQNRLSGMNIFSAFWHKSWFQSRAMVALERAKDHLTTFEERIVPPLSTM